MMEKKNVVTISETSLQLGNIHIMLILTICLIHLWCRLILNLLACHNPNSNYAHHIYFYSSFGKWNSKWKNSMWLQLFSFSNF